MADFEPKRKKVTDFNNGAKIKDGDGIQPDFLNNLVESQLFTQALATNQPDVSGANNVGESYVSIVTAPDGTVQLKFDNLKGERGEQGKPPIIYSGTDITVRGNTPIDSQSSILTTYGGFSTPVSEIEIGDIIIFTYKDVVYMASVKVVYSDAIDISYGLRISGNASSTYAISIRSTSGVDAQAYFSITTSYTLNTENDIINLLTQKGINSTDNALTATGFDFGNGYNVIYVFVKNEKLFIGSAGVDEIVTSEVGNHNLSIKKL